jgi:hypothetical protein
MITSAVPMGISLGISIVTCLLAGISMVCVMVISTSPLNTTPFPPVSQPKALTRSPPLEDLAYAREGLYNPFLAEQRRRQQF